MKVVVDENVSHSLTSRLASLGYEVIAVGADIASGSSDDVVFGKAIEAKGLLITRDYHFTNPARFDPAKTGGIIYIHNGNLTSDQEIALVINFLRAHSPQEFSGKLVTLYSDRVHLR